MVGCRPVPTLFRHGATSGARNRLWRLRRGCHRRVKRATTAGTTMACAHWVADSATRRAIASRSGRASVACAHWVAHSATGRAIAARSARASVACAHWVAHSATGRAIAAVGSAAAAFRRRSGGHGRAGDHASPSSLAPPWVRESWFGWRANARQSASTRGCSPVTRANGRASSRRDAHPPRRHTRGTGSLWRNVAGAEPRAGGSRAKFPGRVPGRVPGDQAGVPRASRTA